MLIEFTIPYKVPSKNITKKMHWGALTKHKDALIPLIFSQPWQVSGHSIDDLGRIQALHRYHKMKRYHGIKPPHIKKTTPQVARPAMLKLYADLRAQYTLRYEQPVKLTITAYLTRLYDDDNGEFKYLIDALRYSGLIYDDASKWCTTTTSQAKADKGAEPTVLIQIQYN